MQLVLTGVFEPVAESDGGGYVAYCEELPGAITEGDTLDEARENLLDAVKEIIEANRELARQAQGSGQAIREEIFVSAA